MSVRTRVSLLAFVLAACLSIHAFAVLLVAPESATNYNPVFRLAYNTDAIGNDKLLLLIPMLLLALIIPNQWIALGCCMTVGGAASQAACFLIWPGSPDYLLIGDYLYNASDIMLFGGLATTFVATIGLVLLWRRWDWRRMI